ncbi:MAG: DNA repair protein RecN [Acidobacteriota bacterium]|nr:DNA repair protein RecN [Acidobacteriota bacterium]
MLKFLEIRDFALVDHLSLEFREGLNLLTGETGSGKSIIVDALGLLAGAKARAEMVRTGSGKATVSGCFEGVERLRGPLEESGLEFDPEGVIVRREVVADGRGRAYVNNQMVPVAFLRKLGTHCVDIHGQSDQQSLFSRDSQLQWLDLYGGHQGPRAEVEDLYARLERGWEQVRRLKLSEQERLRAIDLLSFQVDEIRKAALSSPDEESQLLEERRLLSNADRLFQAAHQAYAHLYESEDSIGARLRQTGRLLEELESLDARCRGLQEQFQSACISIEDVSLALREYASRIEVNPSRLDRIEERLVEIDRLKRKYGESVEAVMAYGRRIEGELEELQEADRKVDSIEKELQALESGYLSRAGSLSLQRKKAAEKLERSMGRELGQLAMEKTRFRVAFSSASGRSGQASSGPGVPGSANGTDVIDFLISPNPGEDLKALAKIASGGEVSRIMLALKTIRSIDDGGKTLIFDEVDSGIGGRAADVVGRKLKVLSRANQVLCVTHLPQIASYADNHFHIEKRVDKNRTVTRVARLDRESRIREIARMISGERVTENVLKHAAELLNSASN